MLIQERDESLVRLALEMAAERWEVNVTTSLDLANERLAMQFRLQVAQARRIMAELDQ